MKDTLHKIISTIKVDASDNLDILNKVDSFYNSAWDKLIIIGSLAFTIVGIVIPFVIQWYQKKTLKLSEELLKKEIEAQTAKVRAEIIQELEALMNEKIKVYEAKIEEFNSSLNAKAFHLQANLSSEKGHHQSALGDYITASFDYLLCNDYQNLLTVLNLISNSCITHLSTEEVNDLKITSGNDINALIEELEKKNNNGALTRIISDIKLKLQKLPKKVKDKPTPDPKK